MGVRSLSFFITLISLSSSFLFVYCWDNEDLELFDLVEEVDQNFYEILNVSNSADGNELRRSYRKLSLQLHPDKNKNEDAELKFRQMVAVYEVLKDEKKRAKYDEVLANGLPDWQQPVYYYRRVRKMGLVELSILLSIILTFGHFITIWAIYWEKRFEKEEVYRSKKKRDKKGRRAQQTVDDVDDKLQEELSLIKRPLITDLLPFALFRSASALVISLPDVLQRIAESLRSWLKSRSSVEVLDGSEYSTGAKVRPARKKSFFARSTPDTTAYDSPPCAVSKTAESSSSVDVVSSHTPETDDAEWTNHHTALLIEAMARYPGGTSERWQKIAVMVGRSVQQVTAKSREVKSQLARSVDPSFQGITAANLSDSAPCTPSLASQNLAEFEHALNDLGGPSGEKSSVTSHQNSADVSVKKSSMKKVDRTLMISAPPPTTTKSTKSMKASGEVAADAVKGMWSQQQQRLLEMALSQFPKGTVDRWDRIAEVVDGKTKDECLQRFKYLANLVVKKKQLQMHQTEQSSQDET